MQTATEDWIDQILEEWREAGVVLLGPQFEHDPEWRIMIPINELRLHGLGVTLQGEAHTKESACRR